MFDDWMPEPKWSRGEKIFVAVLLVIVVLSVIGALISPVSQ
jgi:hypothetical protein